MKFRKRASLFRSSRLVGEICGSAPPPALEVGLRVGQRSIDRAPVRPDAERQHHHPTEEDPRERDASFGDFPTNGPELNGVQMAIHWTTTAAETPSARTAAPLDRG
jgi:hypothetical protein